MNEDMRPPALATIPCGTRDRQTLSPSAKNGTGRWEKPMKLIAWATVDRAALASARQPLMR